MTSSLESLSALVVACPESLSLELVWAEMHFLHLSVPAMSGASQKSQHIAKPICSMALRGSDMRYPPRPLTSTLLSRGHH